MFECARLVLDWFSDLAAVWWFGSLAGGGLRVVALRLICGFDCWFVLPGRFCGL